MAQLDDQSLPPPRIHPTAIVEHGAHVGDGSSVWDSAHLRTGARVGRRCIIGEKTYIAGGASIGDLCKLNAKVYVCAGVTIEDGAMVAALGSAMVTAGVDPTGLAFRAESSLPVEEVRVPSTT